MSAPVPPCFKDLGKSTNDLLGKEYPLGIQTLEVKTKAPNGVLFKAGVAKNNEKNFILGDLEGKYVDGKNGIALTQSWLTNNSLKTQVELEGQLVKGLKLELLGLLNPDKGDKSAVVSAIYRQPAFHGRAFLDVFRGPLITADAVVGRDGFLAGIESSYDIDNDEMKHNAALGYSAPEYSVTLKALNSLSTFQAGYYHRVNRDVEAGAIASYNTKNPNQVNLEVGTKTYLDAAAFLKAKVNSAGLLTLGYTQALRPGVKASFGLALDTVKISQGVHNEKPVAASDATRVGAALVFEA